MRDQSPHGFSITVLLLLFVYKQRSNRTAAKLTHRRLAQGWSMFPLTRKDSGRVTGTN
ncbi:hypothetical protein NSND_60297 [Nitrospira sp. ND1]|nr:hypothetical protein NSND_60297 [Nitrospira sp. ND1]